MDHIEERNGEMKRLLYIILFVLFCMPWFLGVYDEIWELPTKRSEIYNLSQRIEILQVALKEKDEYIEKQNTAMRFENLFLLAADQNDLLDFSELEDYLCDKRGLCTNETN